MSWATAEERISKNDQQDGLWVRLANDGDSAVVVFRGEPHVREVHWDGQKYSDGPGPDGKASIKVSANVIVNGEGTLAAVMVSWRTPTQVLVLRRGKPLSLAWLPEFQAMVYSSEFGHLHAAIEPFEWQRKHLYDGVGGRINVLTMPTIARRPLAEPLMVESTANHRTFKPWSLIP